MMTRDQLRAARILLHLGQEELAAIADVALVTVRRFEGGEEVGTEQQSRIRQAIEEAGAILIAAGRGTDGRHIEGGVALRTLEECSAATRERIASDTFLRRGAKPGGRASRARKRAAKRVSQPDDEPPKEG